MLPPPPKVPISFCLFKSCYALRAAPNKMTFYVYFPAQMLLPSVLPHLGDLLEDGPAIIAFEVELHAVSFTPVHMKNVAF